MSYTVGHWNNPRASIATRYANNDFAYVTRGANTALFILEMFDLSPSEAKKMTILDYGCGTGRVSLFLSRVFGKVVGYDPNKFCIAEAHKENEKSEQTPTNLIYTSNINDIPPVDIAFSCNVIEHLTEQDAQVMINVINLKNEGRTILWYSPLNNGLLSKYMDSEVWESRVKAAHGGGRIQIDFFDLKSNK